MDDKQYYKRKGLVSNSSLNWLEKNPELFRKFLQGELQDVKASYLEVGQLAHLKVLEYLEYEKNVIVYDYTAPKSAQQKAFIEVYNEHIKDDAFEGNEALIAAYKEVYTTKESDDKIQEKATKLLETLDGYRRYLQASKTKTIISSSLSASIGRIEQNIRQHKKANELMYGVSTMMSDGKADSYNEYEVLWEWNGIKCKSLLDRVVVDYEKKVITIVDFKTTFSLSDFKTSFEKYHYDRQLAFYTMAIKSAMKSLVHEKHEGEEYDIECYVVAADTKTEEVKVFNINDLVEPTIQVEKLLSRAKWHIENSKWDHSREYYEGDGCDEL